MQKPRIFIIVGSFVIVLWIVLSVWMYRPDWLGVDTNPTASVGSGSIDPLIKDNYQPKFHILELSNKKLGSMPDICRMVSSTAYVDDIWAIDLSDNALNEIGQDLSCLKNLAELNLSFNNISRIERLSGLTFLKKLDLGNNKITTIEWLDTLRALEDLHAGYNQLASARGIEKLTNLTSLQLQHNSIGDTKGIAGLTKLTKLKLEFNALSDTNLPDFINLPNLKILTLAENKINSAVVAEWNKKSLENMK